MNNEGEQDIEKRAEALREEILEIESQVLWPDSKIEALKNFLNGKRFSEIENSELKANGRKFVEERLERARGFVDEEARYMRTMWNEGRETHDGRYCKEYIEGRAGRYSNLGEERIAAKFENILQEMEKRNLGDIAKEMEPALGEAVDLNFVAKVLKQLKNKYNYNNELLMHLDMLEGKLEAGDIEGIRKYLGLSNEKKEQEFATQEQVNSFDVSEKKDGGDSIVDDAMRGQDINVSVSEGVRKAKDGSSRERVIAVSEGEKSMFDLELKEYYDKWLENKDSKKYLDNLEKFQIGLNKLGHLELAKEVSNIIDKFLREETVEKVLGGENMGEDGKAEGEVIDANLDERRKEGKNEKIDLEEAKRKIEEAIREPLDKNDTNNMGAILNEFREKYNSSDEVLKYIDEIEESFIESFDIDRAKEIGELKTKWLAEKYDDKSAKNAIEYLERLAGDRNELDRISEKNLHLKKHIESFIGKEIVWLKEIAESGKKADRQKTVNVLRRERETRNLKLEIGNLESEEGGKGREKPASVPQVAAGEGGEAGGEGGYDKEGKEGAPIFGADDFKKYSQKFILLKDKIASLEAKKELYPDLIIDKDKESLKNEIEELKDNCEEFLIGEIKNGKSIADLEEEAQYNPKAQELLEEIKMRIEFMDPDKVKERFRDEMEYLISGERRKSKKEDELAMEDKLIDMARGLGLLNEEQLVELEKSEMFFGKKNSKEILFAELKEIKEEAENWAKIDKYYQEVEEKKAKRKGDNERNLEGKKRKGGKIGGIIKNKEHMLKGMAEIAMAFQASHFTVGAVGSAIFGAGFGATGGGIAVAVAGAAGAVVCGRKLFRWGGEKFLREKRARKMDVSQEEVLDKMATLISVHQMDRLDVEKKVMEKNYRKMEEKYIRNEISEDDWKNFLIEAANEKMGNSKKERTMSKKKSKQEALINKDKALLMLDLKEREREAGIKRKIYKTAGQGHSLRDEKIAKKVKTETMGEKVGKAASLYGKELGTLAAFESPARLPLMLFGGAQMGMVDMEILFEDKKWYQENYMFSKKIKGGRWLAQTIGAGAGALTLSWLISGRKAEAAEQYGGGFEKIAGWAKGKTEGMVEDWKQEGDMFSSLLKPKEFFNKWRGGFKARHGIDKGLEERAERIKEKAFREFQSSEREFSREQLDAGALQELVNRADSKSDFWFSTNEQEFFLKNKPQLIEQTKAHINKQIQEVDSIFKTQLEGLREKFNSEEMKALGDKVQNADGKGGISFKDKVEFLKNGEKWVEDIEAARKPNIQPSPGAGSQSGKIEARDGAMGKGPVAKSAPATVGVERITVKSGDKVWNIAERIAQEKLGEQMPKGNTPQEIAQRTYITDAVKDEMAAQMKGQGFEDASLIKEGQSFNIDKGKVMERLKARKIIVDEANNIKQLTPKEVENILKNNEMNREAAKARRVARGKSAKKVIGETTPGPSLLRRGNEGTASVRGGEKVGFSDEQRDRAINEIFQLKLQNSERYKQENQLNSNQYEALIEKIKANDSNKNDFSLEDKIAFLKNENQWIKEIKEGPRKGNVNLNREAEVKANYKEEMNKMKGKHIEEPVVNRNTFEAVERGSRVVKTEGELADGRELTRECQEFYKRIWEKDEVLWKEKLAKQAKANLKGKELSPPDFNEVLDGGKILDFLKIKNYLGEEEMNKLITTSEEMEIAKKLSNFGFKGKAFDEKFQNSKKCLEVLGRTRKDMDLSRKADFLEMWVKPEKGNIGEYLQQEGFRIPDTDRLQWTWDVKGGKLIIKNGVEIEKGVPQELTIYLAGEHTGEYGRRRNLWWGNRLFKTRNEFMKDLDKDLDKKK